MMKLEDMSRELRTLCHAVGLDYKRPYYRNGRMYYRPYRNHYACGRCREDISLFEELAENGYAVRDSVKATMYYLTREGLDWLGEQLNITITEIIK